MSSQPLIQNVVTTGNIRCLSNQPLKLKLKTLVQQIPNSEYNPERFSALIMRKIFPDTTITGLLFSNGRMVCVGAKSVACSKEAICQILEIIRPYIPTANYSVENTEVRNIVGTCCLPNPVNLKGKNYVF